MLKLDLKIVPTASLALHETNDPQRSIRVQKSIKKKGIFTNPILVARLPEIGKYAVLDGANRTSALREMKAPYALVQDFDYQDKNVVLETWRHVLKEKSFNHWLKRFSHLIGFQVCGKMAFSSILGKSPKLHLIDKDKIYCGIIKGGLKRRLDILNGIVNLYRGKYKYERAKDFQDYQDNAEGNHGISLVFPYFSKKSILKITKEKLFIPSGISRHVVQKRVLHFDLPFSILKTKGSLRKKQESLNFHMRKKLEQGKYRCYDGSVCLFDE